MVYRPLDGIFVICFRSIVNTILHDICVGLLIRVCFQNRSSGSYSYFSLIEKSALGFILVLTYSRVRSILKVSVYHNKNSNHTQGIITMQYILDSLLIK